MLDTTDAHTDIAIRADIERICAQRDQSIARMKEALSAFSSAYDGVARAEKVSGEIGMRLDHYHAIEEDRRVLSKFLPQSDNLEKAIEAYRRTTDICVWHHIMRLSRMDRMMDRQALAEFEESLKTDPPEATIENVSATFTRLYGEARHIFLRGLANALSSLDRRFRSHSMYRFKDRAIVDRLATEDGHIYSFSRGMQTITDIERALSVAVGAPEHSVGEASKALTEASRERYGAQRIEVTTHFFRIRVFLNGNAHLWFRDKTHLEAVNKLLAEYYGDILADDIKPDRHQPDLKRDRSNLPSKDLQYFATPGSLVRDILHRAHLRDNLRILEPSAGEGAFVAPLLNAGHSVTAIEIDPHRAAHMRAMKNGQLTLLERNFLSMPARPEFDAVVMNPPFAHTHYIDHVLHAAEFLKPGGRLIAILPVTADIGQSRRHKAFREWIEATFEKKFWDSWFKDLPAGSFTASGTNVNTILLDAFLKNG